MTCPTRTVSHLYQLHSLCEYQMDTYIDRNANIVASASLYLLHWILSWSGYILKSMEKILEGIVYRLFIGPLRFVTFLWRLTSPNCQESRHFDYYFLLNYNCLYLNEHILKEVQHGVLIFCQLIFFFNYVIEN